jgi:uncharacterized protein
LLGLLLVNACMPALGRTAHAAGVQQDPAPGAPQAARESGILFRAVKEDKAVFLFGTIHLGNAAFYPLGPRVLQPLRRSARLLVETDVLDPGLGEAFRRYGLQESPNHLSPEQQKIVDELFHLGAMDPRFGMRIKADLLAGTLVGFDARRLGYTTAYSAESFLLGFARALNIEVVELEGIRAQLSMNDAMPPQERHDMLVATIDSISNGEARKRIARIVDAWQSNDLERLTAMHAETGPASSQPEYFRQQMAQRNRLLADRIVEQSAAHQRVFAAVGVLHLIGETSVQALLTKAGYRVERLF